MTEGEEGRGRVGWRRMMIRRRRSECKIKGEEEREVEEDKEDDGRIKKTA